MEKKSLLLLALCVLFSALLISCSRENRIAVEQTQAIDARVFLTKEELIRSVSEESWAALDLTGHTDMDNKQVKGLIVPHHAAAAALAAESISRLAENPPPAVIILAPNHYNTGSPATGAESDFLCYGRRVLTDATAIKRLSEAGIIGVNDELFKKEHSVGMLLPVIAWYLPDTKVIPVMFHHGYDEQKILALIEALKPEIDDGAVIIASIDFSHYLTMGEAMDKDREMRGYIENCNAETVSRLDSSYVDSPTILAAMLLYFSAEEMEIAANTNSGVLLSNPVSPCTSYFSILFKNKIEKEADIGYNGLSVKKEN